MIRRNVFQAAFRLDLRRVDMLNKSEGGDAPSDELLAVYLRAVCIQSEECVPHRTSGWTITCGINRSVIHEGPTHQSFNPLAVQWRQCPNIWDNCSGWENGTRTLHLAESSNTSSPMCRNISDKSTAVMNVDEVGSVYIVGRLL